MANLDNRVNKLEQQNGDPDNIVVVLWSDDPNELVKDPKTGEQITITELERRYPGERITVDWPEELQ